MFRQQYEQYLFRFYNNQQQIFQNMNRSVSTKAIQQRTISRSPSKRGIYVNQQVNKPQISTIFHSPYKDGRPNKDYINPSFLSSHLFYPQQCLENKEYAVKKNVVPNSNDISKERLYRQRMKSEAEVSERSKSRPKIQRNRQFKKEYQAYPVRNTRYYQPQNILKYELSNLQNYRAEMEANDNLGKHSKSHKQTQQLPIYFERNHRNQEYEIGRQISRRNQLKDWMELTSQLNHINKQLKKSTKTQEHERYDHTIKYNREVNNHQQIQQRKKSQLLGNILREQIKTNFLRKDKSKNY